MTGEDRCFRFVPERARGPRQLLRWRARRLVAALLAPVCGARRLFDGRLAEVLVQAWAGRSGFWIPQAHALWRFGSRLDVDVSVCEVDRLLLDGVELGGRRFHTGHWFIGAGDWSRVLLPLDQHQVSREAIELAAADLRYRDTAVYERYRRRAAAGSPLTRNRVVLDSPAAVDTYFEGFIALFHSIAEKGLVRRAQLDRYRRARTAGGRWLAEFGEQEIGVALAADGRMIKLPGGQHRFAIARALRLGKVPAQVRLMHADALRGQSPDRVVHLLDEGRLLHLRDNGPVGAVHIMRSLQNSLVK